MRLLVTRPAPDGEHTAAALRARGHEALDIPVLHMEKVNCEIADEPYAAVIMTSANGARAIDGHPRCAALAKLPAFTVGEHTARAAAAAGFCNVHCAYGNRDDLARKLQEWCGKKQPRLLYLAGEARAGDLELTPAVAEVVTVIIYRMVAIERLPGWAETALRNRQIDAVLHFSPRSAEVFLDCVRRAGILDAAQALLHFCLSFQVARPLADAGIASIRIAPRPDEAALIGLVA